jgi:DNA mismatch endonuclease (patch repair protein)
MNSQQSDSGSGHLDTGRSRNMSAIKATNTKPELIVRRELFRRGLRFRIHVRELPSRPDIVLPKYRSVVLVNGCFWHGHDCHLFRWPKSNATFWREKIGATRDRDRRNLADLVDLNWRVAVVWQCAIQGSSADPGALEALERWIRSDVNGRFELPSREGSGVGAT